MSLILGLGIGSFILVTIWLLTSILCLISIRTKKIIGILAVFSAGIITTILIVIPKQDSEKNTQEADYRFIWHNILACFLGLCSIGSVVLYITSVGPIQPYKIRTWVQ